MPKWMFATYMLMFEPGLVPVHIGGLFERDDLGVALDFLKKYAVNWAPIGKRVKIIQKGCLLASSLYKAMGSGKTTQGIMDEFGDTIIDAILSVKKGMDDLK
ncbi:hypothetical protein LCGC14_2821540 [marine sediment metagenome]|uniref:Uncharacterized protein n=1 Tax=marine sediment metagenome TaxID=412755 RepID=A0A0F8YGN5_9ZZZZ